MKLITYKQYYSKEELNKIHIEGTSILNQVYRLENSSNIYVGDSDGRLQIADDISGDVEGNLQETEVANIGNYTINEVNELLETLSNDIPTRTEINLDLAELECRLIAFSIVH